MRPLSPVSSHVRVEEAMEPEELNFLRRKEERDRAQLLNVGRVFLYLSFICSFFVSCVRALAGTEDPFNYRDYFAGVGFLLLFSGSGLFSGYYFFLRKVRLDIKRGSKLIERVRVLRKVYMPQNNSYYFYIDSTKRLSIEVTPDDYHRLDTGDEVNIEYAPISNIYFGYY